VSNALENAKCSEMKKRFLNDFQDCDDGDNDDNDDDQNNVYGNSVTTEPLRKFTGILI